jgi:esterase/lipase superfamily enzyme
VKDFNLLPNDDSEFAKFVKGFTENASKLTYNENSLSTPARVNRNTGVIEVKRSLFENNKTRLIIEKDELAEKVKLESFLATEKANEIDKDQLMLLGIQLNAMKTYLGCLTARIDRL